MKQSTRERLSRWRDRAVGGGAREDRAAALVRDALAEPLPDEASLARIERRLFAPMARRERSHWILRLALVGGFLVLGLASVRAYEAARSAGWFGPVLPVEPAPRPSVPAVSRRRTAAAPSPQAAPGSDQARAPDITAPATVVAPASAPFESGHEPETRAKAAAPTRVAVLEDSPRVKSVRASPGLAPPPLHVEAPARMGALPDVPAPTGSVPLVSAPIMPAPTRALTPVPKPALPAPAVPPSPMLEEAHALDRVLALLRREHNARAALVELDSYFVRFPRGVLNREAHLAQVDAFLLLQRSDEALTVLEGLSFDGGRRSTELQVIRAELRARSSCARAEQDFSAALAHSPDARLLERILYGRGSCRITSGDREGATNDLGRYVERFPHAEHAAWARQWLESTEKKVKNGG